MDLPWGSDYTKKFITNVGLITTTGPQGDNIMAAEWTHFISYKPGRIAVLVGKHYRKATGVNIRKTKQFGVSIAATDQNVLSSLAGKVSGNEYDKIGALKELGFKFYNGKKIKALMVEGAALNVELKLIKTVEVGSHTMFIGEALEATPNPNKEPLAYHQNRYWKLGENISKPPQEELGRMNAVLEKHKKNQS